MILHASSNEMFSKQNNLMQAGIPLSKPPQPCARPAPQTKENKAKSPSRYTLFMALHLYAATTRRVAHPNQIGVPRPSFAWAGGDSSFFRSGILQRTSGSPQGAKVPVPLQNISPLRSIIGSDETTGGRIRQAEAISESQKLTPYPPTPPLPIFC